MLSEAYAAPGIATAVPLGAGITVFDASARGESPADGQAAALDLLTRLLSVRRLDDARTMAARLIARHLSADFVAVGCDFSRSSAGLSSAGPLAIIAGPRPPAPERRSDVEAALGECIVTARAHSIDVRQDDSQPAHDSPPGFAHRRLLKYLAATRSIKTIPLLTDDGQCAGAILIASSVDPSRRDQETFLSAVSTPLAQWLLTLQRTAPGKLAQRREKLRTWLTARRKQTVGIALAAAFVIGVVPTRYPILAQATVQPSVRRWIVAPFDAPLKKSHVSPGQAVEAGDLLFTLDCDEVVHKLASLRAESDRSASERSAHLSNGRLAEAAIAGWNIKRLHSEVELLQKLLQRSEIRSPIAGILLGDDLERLEGGPLKLGQTMAEVARLDRLHAAIEIPPDQINHVRQDSEVAISVEAVGTLPAIRISRIHPRAEPNEKGNYMFQGRAELPTAALPIKPGMRGQATIYGNYRPFAWCMFQRLWQRLRDWGDS
ncbi:MAG: efflux RND transporter periplasmic adaptor subunit [Planctomycetaceae bacterium]